MFVKDLRIGFLLDFYGDMLSERKRTVLDRYYNDDLSLSEIADEIGISRQGVRELIKKAEEELLFTRKNWGWRQGSGRRASRQSICWRSCARAAPTARSFRRRRTWQDRSAEKEGGMADYV